MRYFDRFHDSRGSFLAEVVFSFVTFAANVFSRATIRSGVSIRLGRLNGSRGGFTMTERKELYTRATKLSFWIQALAVVELNARI